MDKHQRDTRLSWSDLYSNLALNVVGILVIFSCNVLHRGCEGVALYLGAALFAGVPLFVVTLAAAPVGAFQSPGISQRYRRLFFLNLGLVALIFISASIAVFFR